MPDSRAWPNGPSVRRHRRARRLHHSTMSVGWLLGYVMIIIYCRLAIPIELGIYAPLLSYARAD